MPPVTHRTLHFSDEDTSLAPQNWLASDKGISSRVSVSDMRPTNPLSLRIFSSIQEVTDPHKISVSSLFFLNFVSHMPLSFPAKSLSVPAIQEISSNKIITFPVVVRVASAESALFQLSYFIGGKSKARPSNSPK